MSSAITALFRTTCHMCNGLIHPGASIARHNDRTVHVLCRPMSEWAKDTYAEHAGVARDITEDWQRRKDRLARRQAL